MSSITRCWCHKPTKLSMVCTKRWTRSTGRRGQVHRYSRGPGGGSEPASDHCCTTKQTSCSATEYLIRIKPGMFRGALVLLTSTYSVVRLPRRLDLVLPERPVRPRWKAREGKTSVLNGSSSSIPCCRHPWFSCLQLVQQQRGLCFYTASAVPACLHRCILGSRLCMRSGFLRVAILLCFTHRSYRCY